MLAKSGLFGNPGRIHVLLIFLLAIPAFYINLDMLPLIGDEAIRAVVAMEMMLSGDYITPTLNGEMYFNKPPLYNWILIGFFELLNDKSEFAVRFPTTLFLLGYCLTLFFWIKNKLGLRMGFLSTLLFLTCGRILFWDSFLGLIDIAFSWIIFTNFMIIGHWFEKQHYGKLFIFSYLLTAVAFLLKGIPSLAFQAITLLVVFIDGRKFRKLISWSHTAGILLFIFVCGVYYLIYYLKNPAYLDDALLRLISESSDKSAIGSTFRKTVSHFIEFPFDVIRHFLPWSALLVFIFNKPITGRLFKHRFIRFSILVFLANLIIYWFSPITYPRYLLMLMPLMFVVILYAARMHALLKTRVYNIVSIVFRFLIIAMVAGFFIVPVIFAGQLPVKNVFLKATAIGTLALITFLMIRNNQTRYGLFYNIVILLLLARISFNFFILPYRQSQSWVTLCRSDAIKLARASSGEEMYVKADTITMHNVYYLTRERNDILRYKHDPEPGPWFITDKNNDSLFTMEYTMRVPYHYKTYYAGKYKEKQ